MKPIFVNSRMNRVEARYCQQLELLKRAGEIVDYRFEPFGLKLADKTYYHPDFLVVHKDRFEIIEIKGFMRDDANVKIKVAAKEFPWFDFKLVHWNSKTKKFEERVI
ncbi:MAG: hypothetical protein DDT22_01374 [candidate division WS2 bacterium]|nr:hypothetical protein [Candidatus Lithacetigena glycinireducens]